MGHNQTDKIPSFPGHQMGMHKVKSLTKQSSGTGQKTK